MAAGFSAPSHKSVRGRMQPWFRKNQSKLFTLDIVCMVLLLFLHLFTTTFQVFTPAIVSVVQVVSITLVSFIVLSVVWKGIVPTVICIIGIVLMYNAIMLPYSENQGFTFETTKFADIQNSPAAMAVAISRHFFLGAGMAAFSIILAYRPSILFTRNRPQSLDSEWSKYPVWHDNTLLAEGRTEQAIPVKNLMTEQDRYLLWRYEYILANIYGTPYLVRPEGMVPKDSTDIFRDKASGRVVGKARYTGFFV